MTWEVREGDCVELMAAMPAGSVDAVVCDPPAGIGFMGRTWDHHRGGRNEWVEWMADVLREALRVCKPGAHAFVWSLPRTSHWTGSALEMAGWEVRDVVSHMFGSGFPKSHNLPNGYGTALKPAAEFWWLARKPLSGTVAGNVLAFGTGALNIEGTRVAHDEPIVALKAQQSDQSTYQQAGRYEDTTELKESGRWPANVVLSHTEGCVQVGTRKVGGGDRREATGDAPKLDPAKGWIANSITRGGQNAPENYGTETVGAWSCTPDCPVRLLDEQTGELKSPRPYADDPAQGERSMFRAGGVNHDREFGDSGGASRFFYCAKSSRGERNAGLEGFEEKLAGSVIPADTAEYDEFVYPVPDGLGAWLRQYRQECGLSTKAVCDAVGAHGAVNHGGAVSNWEAELSRPNPDQWRRLREVLGFDERHDEAMTTTRHVVSSSMEGKKSTILRSNTHPTVKPISLMRWLVRLVTPPGGTICDPFTGSGTTGIASMLEAFDFIGLEREPEYVEIARARIAWWHKHRGDGEAADILAAGELRDEVEATGQMGMFD